MFSTLTTGIYLSLISFVRSTNAVPTHSRAGPSLLSGSLLQAHLSLLEIYLEHPDVFDS